MVICEPSKFVQNWCCEVSEGFNTMVSLLLNGISYESQVAWV